MDILSTSGARVGIEGAQAEDAAEMVIQSEWVLHAKLERIWWSLQGENELCGIDIIRIGNSCPKIMKEDNVWWLHLLCNYTPKVRSGQIWFGDYLSSWLLSHDPSCIKTNPLVSLEGGWPFMNLLMNMWFWLSGFFIKLVLLRIGVLFLPGMTNRYLCPDSYLWFTLEDQ